MLHEWANAHQSATVANGGRLRTTECFDGHDGELRNTRL